jgi:cytochrome c oxidase subunit 4
MASAHHDVGHHGHGPTFKAYMAVAVALSGFTVISFVCNWAVRYGYMSAVMAFVIILGVAIVKSILVGLYFMHLKWEWGKLYFMILPAFILGTMMMMVLMPDIVVAWHHDPYDVPPPVSQSGNR